MADGAGRNARKIRIDWAAAGAEPSDHKHNHNMVWSPDNAWIYFVSGSVRDWNHQNNEMDIWRIPPSGGTPERLTYLNTSVTFLAMLDQRHAGLHRARAGWVRIVALVPGCREPPNVEKLVTKVVGSRPGDPAADPDGRRPIHVDLRQPRPRATGGHRERTPQPRSGSVPILANRQADESDVVPLPRSDRTGAVAALRAPRRVAGSVFPVGTGNRRQAVELQERRLRDYQGRGRAPGRDTGAGARRKPGGGCRQRSGTAAPRRHEPGRPGLANTGRGH